MPNLITEDQFEQVLLGRLATTSGGATLNCFTADPANPGEGSGRTDKREVILRAPLHAAAQRLIQQLPERVTSAALERLYDYRAAMTEVMASREVHDLLRNGIAVEFDDAQGCIQRERLRVIDFREVA